MKKLSYNFFKTKLFSQHKLSLFDNYLIKYKYVMQKISFFSSENLFIRFRINYAKSAYPLNDFSVIKQIKATALDYF